MNRRTPEEKIARIAFGLAGAMAIGGDIFAGYVTREISQSHPRLLPVVLTVDAFLLAINIAIALGFGYAESRRRREIRRVSGFDDESVRRGIRGDSNPPGDDRNRLN